MSDRLVLALQKLLDALLSRLGGMVWAWVMGGVLLLAAVALVVLVLRFLRRPFLTCASRGTGTFQNPFAPAKRTEDRRPPVPGSFCCKNPLQFSP